MGAARLLPEREDCAEDCRCPQHPAGKLGSGPEQHEVERHQREARCGMGTGEALAARQLVRPVGEKRDVRTVAFVGREVPRAIHVGHQLEQADGRRAQKQSRHDEGRGALQGAQAIRKPAGDHRDERGEADQPHQPLAGRVYDIERPPASGTDPPVRYGVVENVIGNPEIQLAGPERDRRDGKQARGYPCVAQPEPRTLGTRV